MSASFRIVVCERNEVGVCPRRGKGYEFYKFVVLNVP